MRLTPRNLLFLIVAWVRIHVVFPHPALKVEVVAAVAALVVASSAVVAVAPASFLIDPTMQSCATHEARDALPMLRRQPANSACELPGRALPIAAFVRVSRDCY